MKKRKKQKTAYQRQKAKTWRAFSRMVRTRDCLSSTGTLDMGVCCTCGGTFPFKDLQAGHFIPGRTNSVLFNEFGVNAQCRGCNVFGNGQPALYEAFMLENYGSIIVDELRAARHEWKKFSIETLRNMQESYERRTERMEASMEPG